VPAGEHLRTKTPVAGEWLRQADAESAAPSRGVFEGADAVDTVVAPGRHPRAGQRRLEILTRVPAKAQLSHAAMPKPRAQERRPLWGPRLAAPPPPLY
jgi:hypothetical protein